MCSKCRFSCTSRREIYNHSLLQHGNADNLEGFEVELDDDDDLRDVYKVNRPHILSSHRDSADGMVYNFPTNNLQDGVSEFTNHLNTIYDNENEAFKVNVSIGIILRDVATGQYRYWIPYSNYSLFDTPEVVSNRAQLNRVIAKLLKLDIREYVNLLKSDSSLKPIFITNIMYYVYRTSYPLGTGVMNLPDSIKKSHVLVSLDKDNRGKAYSDSLCMFRCLYYHRNKCVREKGVKELYDKWCAYTETVVAYNDFKGVELSKIPAFEDCFEIKINMYELVVSNGNVIPRYQSKSNSDESMSLNLYENHTSYITNFPAYAKKFQCPSCDRHFPTIGKWKRHLAHCSNLKKLKFPGGYLTASQTVFEKLEAYGIVTPKEHRIYPYFCVFDIESLLLKADDRVTDRLHFTQQHYPISVSINSSVPGFNNPKHIVNENMDDLLESMLSYMTTIANAACTLTKQKLEPYMARLQELYEAVKPEQKRDDRGENAGFDMESDGESGDESDTEQDRSFINDESFDDEPPSNPYMNPTVPVQKPIPIPNHTDPNRCVAQSIKRLQQELERYCQQLPVLGFNSAKYDLNVLKAKLAKHLKLDVNGFVIKRANAYSCISTEHFKFLDITSYLAAGASYDKFLKSYAKEESKSFFPYDWFDNVAKLDHPCLPPYEAFYSTLKRANTLESNGSGPDNYRELQSIWTRENMTTFRDFLKYYNNEDVRGFVVGVERMLAYYVAEGIDLFKDTISLPNLARQQLFKTTNAVFPLFDSSNQDIYRTFQTGVCGGPSIIYKREAKAGVTPIRNNPDIIGQRIMGHDANGLYGYAIAQDMPTGCFVVMREETGFKAESSTKYIDMYIWMDYMASKHSITIQHKLNINREVQIGPYRVDGYCPETMTVYEYNGCWYHYCEICQPTSDKPDTLKRQQRARQRTDNKREYLTKLGYTLVEERECHYKKHIEKLVTAIKGKYIPPFARQFGHEKKDKSFILGMVRMGHVFGAVEVDIETPTEWNDLFSHELPPQEYFAEFSPIFCTTDVPFEHFGSHMQDFVETNGLSKDPRRLLVGGMSARKILLATPLLQWYLLKGMHVTRVYKLIEFTPKACFKHMTDKVSAARREGDRDPSKSLIADSNKLLICSAYGGLLLNKEKHQRVTYAHGSRKLRLRINDPKFCHFTSLDDDMFEVEMLKSTINCDLPNYLGFFVLNYAKLHMLRFYYDVLDYFIPRPMFELLEMDTDSIYAFYASHSLIEVVRDDKKVEFNNKLMCCEREEVDAETGHWFPRECCTKHSAYDKRTPGLFKLEASGDHMICLTSKTYLLMNKDTAKRSHKGVMMSSVSDPLATYSRTINNKTPQIIENVGFRARHNTMCTYQQRKTGFSYPYFKREVQSNGVDTKPLALVLTPWTDHNCVIISYDSILSNHHTSPMRVYGHQFFSANHIHLFETATYFGLIEEREKILNCPNSFMLSKIKLKFTPTIEYYGEAIRKMESILKQKATAYPRFLEQLRAIRGTSIYVSGMDRYWCCGMVEKVARVTNPDQYPGRNILGKVLHGLANA